MWKMMPDLILRLMVFWGGQFEKAFFDFRIFNHCAQSNHQSSLQATYKNMNNWREDTMTSVYVNRTWYFYTSSPVYHRRHGESSNHLLQKTHFLPRSQKGWELQSNNGLAEQLPEFCFIVVLNYAHQRCSLFNEQTNSGQSHQFAVSRFSDALNQVTNLPLYYYFFSLSCCFSLTLFFTVLDVLPFTCFPAEKKRHRYAPVMFCC